MATYEDLPKLLHKQLEGSLKPDDLQKWKENPQWIEALAEFGKQLETDLDIVVAIAHDEEDGIPWKDQIVALSQLLAVILGQRRIETPEKQKLVECLLCDLIRQYPIDKAFTLLKKNIKGIKKEFSFGDSWMNQSYEGTDIIKECLGEEETEPTAKLVREYMEMRPEEKSELVAKNRKVRNNFCILKAIADEEEDCYSWRAQVDAVTDVLALLLDVKKDKTEEKREVVDLLADVFFYAATRQLSNEKQVRRFGKNWIERFVQGLAEIDVKE